MKRVLASLRIFGGLLVLLSGLMMLGLFGWKPPEASEAALPLQTAMHGAGYFMPLMTAVFLGAGASFILDRFVALSAVVLFPISLNILLFHTLLEAGQLPIAAVFFGVNCFMLWISRRAYSTMLSSRLPLS